MKMDEEALKIKAVEEFFAFHEMLGVSENIGFKPFKKKSAPKEKPKILTPIKMPETILGISEEIKKFEGCTLKRFAQNTVIGDGSVPAKIMLIGEAPGEEEDINGIPFCGRSGRLLEAAMNKFGIFRDKNCYITNSVFWRPPANRKPETEELNACRPFLEKMIKIIKPELIIAVGTVSIQNATFVTKSISELRRKEFSFKFLHETQEDYKVITLYHPSYLLRSPAKKRDLYLDMLWAKREILGKIL
jgi:DNA polymerase